jgi:Baseplate J-like protein
MPLKAPNLDDRNFDELLAEAQREIEKSCPTWTDRTPSDPGIVLLEAFAYLTETMIYRLNRIPEKAYIEFLRLIGLTMQPPSAASVELTFKASQTPTGPILIPRGTRVSVSRAGPGGEPIVFSTVRPVQIPAGKLEAQVTALNCDTVEGELVGTGTGLPGQVVSVARPPIIAPSGEQLDIIVGIEAAANELGDRVHARRFKDKTYRIWREVENFVNLGPDPFVYVVDRMAGRISFAPAVRTIDESGSLLEAPHALAAIVPAQREIRVWYRCGGGPNGNVAAGSLTTLKDPIAGVTVTNANPATGGSSAETLENALIRGPQELYSLRRAVTARDFELVALRSSGAVARATAFTEANLWTHARPGTVRVVLVPSLSEEEREAGKITSARMHEFESPQALSQVEGALEERRPLGTACLVSWARYKTVRVAARIVAHAEEDIDALKSRVLSRLNKSISPLPSKGNPGWRFGEALRVSHVYDVALSEPGVSYVDNVALLVQDVPESNVSRLAVDFFQPHTWYAGSEGLLFRSGDDGDGWETVGRFADETISSVRAHPDRPGVLAVATMLAGAKPASRIRVSRNCGESWQMAAETAFVIESMAWTIRDGVELLLLATDAGLYELLMSADASPVQVFVHDGDQQLGFYSVVASPDIRGWTNVAVASRGTGGIFYSSQGGRGNTFRPIGLNGEDVRILMIERVGVTAYLWAGMATDVAGGIGKGCMSVELLGDHDSPAGWQTADKGWDGGSCRGLAVQGSRILAATHHKGVLQLSPRQADSAWEVPAIGCGLPLREAEAERLFYSVDALAAHPEGTMLLAAGPKGVYRANSAMGPYACCSSRSFTDKVTLPPTWLFCSGEHQIEMVHERGTGQD